MVPLIIFHSLNGAMHCDDGFAAAWVAHRALTGIEGEPELHPGIYGEAPPLGRAQGRQVFLVDFSYKRGAMQALVDVAARVTVIDHHKTAWEELKDFKPRDFELFFDLVRSGAQLTWDYFYADAPCPELLNYIGDADLWIFERPFAREVQWGLRSYLQNLSTWELLD